MTDAPGRPLRRRRETRRLLLDAARALFDERGTIGLGVETICARAGFTRGAFYSNFSSVDELYLSLHETQAGRLWEDLRVALDDELGRAPHGSTLQTAVGRLLAALPPHREWFSLRAVLLARAAVDESFAATLRIDEHAASALGSRLIALAAVYGRTPTVSPAVVAKVVVAAHVGAVSHAALEGDATALESITVAAALRGLTVEAPAQG